MFWWKSVTSSSRLVITGAGIDRAKIVQKAWILPGQKWTELSLVPVGFKFTSNVMSTENLVFSIPVSVLVAIYDKEEGLKKYVNTMIMPEDGREPAHGHIASVQDHRNTIQSILEGGIRNAAASMSIKEIFSDRDKLKAKCEENIKPELDKLGLHYKTVVIEEFKDADGSDYFASLSKKAHAGVQNQAKVDVALATKIGDVESARTKGESEQAIAKISADTAVMATKRRAEQAQAEADLKLKEQAIAQVTTLNNIHNKLEADELSADLSTKVQQKNAASELAKKRATVVVAAKIDKESQQETADAKYYTESKAADANKAKRLAEVDGDVYEKRETAKAQQETTMMAAQAKKDAATLDAEAQFIAASRQADAIKVAADAELHRKTAEAEAIIKKAAGLKELIGVFGGNAEQMFELMRIENDVPVRMAHENGLALKGLNPNMTFFADGGGASGSGSVSNPMEKIKEMMQTLPQMSKMMTDQGMGQNLAVAPAVISMDGTVNTHANPVVMANGGQSSSSNPK